jgi:hypothetical protein
MLFFTSTTTGWTDFEENRAVSFPLHSSLDLHYKFEK